MLKHEVRYARFMNLIDIGMALLISSLIVLAGPETSVNESNPTENPYRTIVERNPFGLKPPPPPAPAPQPVAEQAKTDLKLTGITWFGSPKAYFIATQPKDNKTEYFSLGLDEKKDGIEVLAIEEGAKSVRIRNAGVETLMTFATHGVAPPVGPTAPAATPGVSGVPGAGFGMPGVGGTVQNMPVTTGYAPGISPSSGLRTIPARTPRTQMDQTMAARYGLGSAPVSNLPPQPVPQNTPRAEEAVILLEAQRLFNPSLPPTPGLQTTTDLPPPIAPAPGPGVRRMPRLPGQ